MVKCWLKMNLSTFKSLCTIYWTVLLSTWDCELRSVIGDSAAWTLNSKFMNSRNSIKNPISGVWIIEGGWRTLDVISKKEPNQQSQFPLSSRIDASSFWSRRHRGRDFVLRSLFEIKMFFFFSPLTLSAHDGSEPRAQCEFHKLSGVFLWLLRCDSWVWKIRANWSPCQHPESLGPR